MQRESMVENVITREYRQHNYNDSIDPKMVKNKTMFDCSKCGRTHAEKDCRAKNFNFITVLEKATSHLNVRGNAEIKSKTG